VRARYAPAADRLRTLSDGRRRSASGNIRPSAPRDYRVRAARPSTSLPLDRFGIAYRDRTITAAIVRLVSPRSRLSLRSPRFAG
jgi:hypothetical protein